MSNKIEFIVLGDTKDLEKKLKTTKDAFDKLGKISGFAFAGLTATTFGLINAFREEEQAINQLNQALKNSGNFSQDASKDLQDYASKLQNLTLFTDDAIIKAEGLIAQFGFEGQVLKDVTKATLDFAQAKGIDLASAADIVAKSIGSDTNALKRYGVEIEGAAGSTQRANSFIENSSRLFKGQAESATQGYGALIQLKNTLTDLGDEIAKKLQPSVSKFASDIKGIADFLKNNPAFAQLAADILILGIQVSALGIGISLVAKATFAWDTAMVALNSSSATFIGYGLFTNIGILTKNVGLLYPAVILVATAFAAWNIGRLIGEVTGLDKAIIDFFKHRDDEILKKKLGSDFVSEEDFNAQKGQGAWAERAAARQADLDAEVAAHKVKKTLQQEELENAIAFQEQIAALSTFDLTNLTAQLTQESELTKTFEQQKTEIIRREMAAREQLREADKNTQLASLSFASQMVQAFGKESKAAFFILKALRIAEILVNSFAASMNISAVWAWNPPVNAALQGQNRVLTALNLAGVIGTAIAGFAVGSPSIPKDMTANIHKGEMIIPATFSDAIRSGDLALSGGGNGGGSGVTVDLRGSTFNGITDDFVEKIFTKAAENINNRTLAFRGA